jgi:hypothetical protein
MADRFCLGIQLPCNHKGFFYRAANLRHGANSFTSLPKEGMLRIFTPEKNPRTWVPEASMLTTWPPKPLCSGEQRPDRMHAPADSPRAPSSPQNSTSNGAASEGYLVPFCTVHVNKCVSSPHSDWTTARSVSCVDNCAAVSALWWQRWNMRMVCVFACLFATQDSRLAALWWIAGTTAAQFKCLGRDVDISLAPQLRICGAIPPLPHMPS